MSIRQIPYMVQSLCVNCWYDKTHPEGEANPRPDDQFKTCQMCRTMTNRAFSLITAEASYRIGLSRIGSGSFLVDEANSWSGETLYINSLCGACWYKGTYPEEALGSVENSIQSTENKDNS